MISVVLITYNQRLEDILFSISSVIHQTGCEYELIVADDHSETDQSEDILRFLARNGFSRYRYLRQDENLGIVRNLLDGVRASSGDVIKLLSPADALYSPHTLSNIEQFCLRKDFRIGFGKLAGYQHQTDGFSFFPYEAPVRPKRYNDPSIDCRTLLKDQIVGTNWVPGCALFYKRAFIEKYLTMLYYDYGIRYGEDLSCPLITKDRTRIDFFDEYVLWYEVGNGITTSGSKNSRKRIYGDHRRFYTKLASDEADPLYTRALRLFKMREFIALHTPVYGFAQSLVQHRYMRARKAAGQAILGEMDFFYRCRQSATHHCFSDSGHRPD